MKKIVESNGNPTPEEWSEFLAAARELKAREAPIISQWKAGEITREKAVDLLAEGRGDSPQTRRALDRKLMRIKNRPWVVEQIEKGIYNTF